MEKTGLKTKTVTCLALICKLISIVFDMQINFYFPEYSTAPAWVELRVTMLFKRMKTIE